MLEARRPCNKALPVAAPPAPSVSCFCLLRWTLEAFSLISVSLPLNTELGHARPLRWVGLWFHRAETQPELALEELEGNGSCNQTASGTEEVVR